MISNQGIVHQNAGRLSQRCDNQIHESIVVQIDKGCPALITGKQKIRPHLVGDVFQCLAVDVPEHRIVLPRGKS